VSGEECKGCSVSVRVWRVRSVSGEECEGYSVSVGVICVGGMVVVS
jgi:hypothetical protein